MKKHLLEISFHDGSGYMPLVDFDEWRVAMLNFSHDLLPENIRSMQRHNDTDEVFVLLQGKCILFVADGTASAGAIYAEDMEPLKGYNVKKGVWHSHVLSPDARVLIVENRDTTYDNSPFCDLDASQRKFMAESVRKFWEQE